MYDASKYTDRQQHAAALLNDVRTTDFRHFGRQLPTDNSSAANCSRFIPATTNGWHRDSDRSPSRTAAGPTSSGNSSPSNGARRVQPSESQNSIVSTSYDEASYNASSGATVTDYRHLMTSSAPGNANNGVNGVTTNSSSKTPSNGLRLNISNYSASRSESSEVNHHVGGAASGAGNSISTSGYNGDVDVIKAPYRTDSVTTTASTASSSSPGCETPGDEPAFSPTAAALTRPRHSTAGRYRLVSLVDQYFPVTFGGSACSTHQSDRTLSGRASSASGVTAVSTPRRSNGRTQSNHQHQHKRRHHHRPTGEHRSRQQQQQQQSQRRPGSGHSSSSSRSAASSVDVIYGPVAAAVSPSGDVITLNGGTSVLTSTPYQTELTRLRIDRLRIEEERMSQLKTLQQVEINRGPVAKWYELKTPQFHYEAHKNNRQISVSSDFDVPFSVVRVEHGINGSSNSSGRTSQGPATGVTTMSRSLVDI